MFFSFLSLLAFRCFITSTPCISQALSTFSLSHLLASHFGVFFLLPVSVFPSKRTSPLVWSLITKKNQNNEGNYSSTLRGKTLPWHRGFLWQQISVAGVPAHPPSPTTEADFRLCMSLFCRQTAIPLQGHFIPELTGQRCRCH